MLPDGRLSGALRHRVECAARAWRQQQAHLVVCSGGRSWHGVVEAAAMRDALICLGVTPECILLETASLSTAENARETSALLGREGIGRAVLVTSHWHLPRALANFRLCGLQPTPLGAPSSPAPPARRALRFLFERLCQRIDRARLSQGRSP